MPHAFENIIISNKMAYTHCLFLPSRLSGFCGGHGAGFSPLAFECRDGGRLQEIKQLRRPFGGRANSNFIALSSLLL